jgi:hypothetical protein
MGFFFSTDDSCSQNTHKSKIVTVRYASLHLRDLFASTTLYCVRLPPHSNPTAIMPKCCIICKAEASPDLQLQYCDACQSALYCSTACQRKDWRKQHIQICKLLNVGHGDMQVRHDIHMSRSAEYKELFETQERNLEGNMKRFFKLFEESTFEESRAAARKMRKVAKRESKHNQEFTLFDSLHLLIRSDSEMLSWPNSPLLVMLQFVDPNVLAAGDENELFQEGETDESPLHDLADLADPFDFSSHENQLILAKQLFEHGANANAASIPLGRTPLHNACYAENVTNLDFIELLLEKGADPNFQDHLGLVPLIFTIPDAPGAAKFLLNWPTTDVNITTQSGESLLSYFRSTIMDISDEVARPDNPDQVQDQFWLQQWREIAEMLVERSTSDTGITTILTVTSTISRAIPTSPPLLNFDIGMALTGVVPYAADVEIFSIMTSLWINQFYSVFGLTLIVSIVYLILTFTCTEVTVLLLYYLLCAKVLTGVIPFAAAYVELFFIMTSLWMDQFYYVFGFTLIVYLILIVTCAEVTVLLVYYQLCAENHRWWWCSFFCSGSTAVYTFVYSIFWLFRTLEESRMLMTYLLYFGYMFLICFGMFMVFGMVGAMTSLWFIRRIFGTIKVD